MATKRWLISLLLTVNLRDCTADKGFSVDPPDDIMIRDPGFLGYLEISWSPPASLTDAKECPKLYQLEYFDTYRGSWSAVRTPMRSFSAQFDLMKDVRVRVYTLLSGDCTNGGMIKSTNYTELVQKPRSTGAADTQVQGFGCVNFNMTNVECTWQRGTKAPENTQQHLYFWHKDLENAEECPNYIVSRGQRSGCNFTGTSLPLFTDINFCVNGSSPDGPLRPKFASLQLQNHIKPPTTEKLKVLAGPDTVEITWEPPASRVPRHCLTWEVERRVEGPDGKDISELTLALQVNLTLPSTEQRENNCFRVRSKLLNACGQKSFWSDWSHPTCLFEKAKYLPEAEQDRRPFYVYVAGAIIPVLLLFLCVASAAFKKCKMTKSVNKHAAMFC